MRERVIEKKLVKWVKSKGGLCLKMNGLKGVPDRLVLLPNGVTAFIELKAPGEKPAEVQMSRIQKLCELGHNVAWYDDADKMLAQLEYISHNRLFRLYPFDA